MAVSTTPSALWTKIPTDLVARLVRALDRGLAEAPDNRATIWFRADDIAAPGGNFQRVIETFTRHRTPLALAVVPGWVTRQRWAAIRRIGKPGGDLWCWHQHGWRHANHEVVGKKQEFGSARPAEAVVGDLRKGRDRLRDLLGEDFYPAFTPPWNRCGPEALTGLVDLGFRALSRSDGAKPPSPPDLPEFPVNVDLHTRREADPETGWENFLSELQSAVSAGTAGIMLHHQRMNDAAVNFLDRLLPMIGGHSGFRVAGLPELAAAENDPDRKM